MSEALHQAQAGMAYRDIAASAYRAYAASTGNKNFRDEERDYYSSDSLLRNVIFNIEQYNYAVQ